MTDKGVGPCPATRYGPPVTFSWPSARPHSRPCRRSSAAWGSGLGCAKSRPCYNDPRPRSTGHRPVPRAPGTSEVPCCCSFAAFFVWPSARPTLGRAVDHRPRGVRGSAALKVGQGSRHLYYGRPMPRPMPRPPLRLTASQFRRRSRHSTIGGHSSCRTLPPLEKP
jgi:hypothetical protein